MSQISDTSDVAALQYTHHVLRWIEEYGFVEKTDMQHQNQTELESLEAYM